MKHLIPLTLISALLPVTAQEPKREHGTRKHSANKSQPTQYYPATETAPVKSQISITIEGNKRVITANGMPDHKMGKYPNSGNPNTPTVQDFKVSLPLNPVANKTATPTRKDVGILVNGILIEAGTGESWNAGRKWNYNALGGAINFGIDDNHAHVQPTGKYHYHGLPTGLIKKLEITEGKHSALIGWAFDGFPIYALYGYEKGSTTKVIQHTSSYRLKKGMRPKSPEGPGGKYDGAFNNDFEYVEGLGTLDECNGCFTVTPEFPNGTYAYFLTEEWPVIMTHFRGTSAVKRGRGGPRPPRH